MGKKAKKNEPAGPKVEDLKKFTEMDDPYRVDLSTQEREVLPFDAIKAHILLTKVDLSNNFISRLPSNIGMLDHIISLDLSNNRVFELPDSIGDLVDLKKLNLYQNGLTKLPHTFAQLTKLRWLNLAGNNLKEDFVSEATITLCSDENECRACAKGVLARMTVLATKKRKNDERLARKADKEAAIEKAAQKERKEADKDKRRAEYAAAQAAKNAAPATPEAKAVFFEPGSPEAIAAEAEAAADRGAVETSEDKTSRGCCGTLVHALILAWMVLVVTCLGLTAWILSQQNPPTTLEAYITEVGKHGLVAAAAVERVVQQIREKAEL